MKLNVRADPLAERYLLMHPRGLTGYLRPNRPHFPQMGASVLIGNTGIHSATSHRVRVAIQQKLYETFFLEKHSIEFSYSSIHGVAFSQAFKAKSVNERVMITKFIHGWLQQAQDALSSPKGAHPVLIAKILKPQSISSPVTFQKLSAIEDSE